jgi:hypothetical protein
MARRLWPIGLPSRETAPAFGHPAPGDHLGAGSFLDRPASPVARGCEFVAVVDHRAVRQVVALWGVLKRLTRDRPAGEKTLSPVRLCHRCGFTTYTTSRRSYHHGIRTYVNFRNYLQKVSHRHKMLEIPEILGFFGGSPGLPHTVEVTGSSPVSPTSPKPCRILDLDTCRWSAVRPVKSEWKGVVTTPLTERTCCHGGEVLQAGPGSQVPSAQG